MQSLRAIKIAAVVMGVLIVVATTALVVIIAKRLSAPTAASVAAILDEPAGTRIAAIAATQDRLAVQLQGGGPDRVVLLDPRTGAQLGSIALAR